MAASTAALTSTPLLSNKVCTRVLSSLPFKRSVNLPVSVFFFHLILRRGSIYAFSAAGSILYLNRSLFCLYFQKDVDLAAFSPSLPFSFRRCERTVSKKICSVMTPQQSERKPSASGSVGFPSIDFHSAIGIKDYVVYNYVFSINFRSKRP